MNFNIRVGISALSFFQCSRRQILSLLAAKKGIRPKMEVSKYLMAGKALHAILQETFRYHLDKIHYHFYRKKLSLSDSILNVMKALSVRWETFFRYEAGFPWEDNRAEISGALSLIDDHLPILAQCSLSLLDDTQGEKSVQTLTVADEFEVMAKLRRNIILNGRIDLLAREDHRLRFIELKTGSPKDSDEFQLRLYREIAKQTSPDIDISLELWYTKPSSDLTNARIKNVTDIHKSLLKKLNEIIEIAASIKESNDLPERIYDPYLCRYCKYCDQINQLFPI